MKKILLICWSMIFAYIAVGCSSQSYNDAIELMKNGDYQAAIEIFESIPEYKDATTQKDECEKYIEYNKAIDAFSEKKYNEACDIFGKLGDFEEATSYFNQAVLEITNQFCDYANEEINDAVLNHDIDGVISIIIESRSVEHGKDDITSTIESVVIESVNRDFSNPSYTSFVFLDNLINAVENVDNTKTLYTELNSIRNNNESKRAAAFLSGKWVRMDGTGFNGLKIEVIITENTSIGIVLEDIKSPTGSYYNKDDIKWSDINILNDTKFRVVDYSSKTASNKTMSGMESICTIDYDCGRIFLHSVEDNNDYSLGRDQVLVREDAILNVAPLTEDDFVIDMTNTDEVSGTTTINVIEEKKVYFTDGASNQFALSREIGVGNTWHDVVEAYGYGISNYFNTTFEATYKKIPQDNQKLLIEQVDEFMDYSVDNHHIRFYFSNGVVSWIIIY